MDPEVIRRELVTRVLRLLSAERGDETGANYGDDVDYCADAVDDAAKALVFVLNQKEKQ